MNLITELMTAIAEALTSFIGLMGDAFEGVIALLWASEGGFTMVGYLFILGLAIGIFYFVWRFVRYLFSLRANK